MSIRRHVAAAITCVLASVGGLAHGGGEPALTVESMGFYDAPMYATAPDGDFDRLFILERSGRIQIAGGGTFLDISSEVDQTFEGGMLGLAFHPQYMSNGRFYVHYTAPGSGGFQLISVIEEYTVSASDPDVADPASARTILTVGQPASNHNAGWIGFSPVDGYLYIPFGDGGFVCCGQARAQDLTDEWMGKVLRIDVDGDDFPADPDRNYAIPPTNPYVGVTGDDEIWAAGLRNPFRSGFDRETGDLYLGDVGEGMWEEVSFQPADDPGGRNYGWGCMEAFVCDGSFCVCNDPSLTLPLHAYSHDFGCAITGGDVYRGCAMPELDGTYFFADFCSNLIWSLRVVDGEATALTDRTDELGTGGDISSITGFGTDAYGELYICSLGGIVWKIVPVVDPPDGNGNGIPDSCEPAPEDLNGDGLVGFSDLLALLASWGPCKACPADFDDSGEVTFQDLLQLLSAWTV